MEAGKFSTSSPYKWIGNVERVKVLLEQHSSNQPSSG